MKFLYSLLIMLSFYNSNAQTLRHAEMLGRPTDNSITVQAFFDNAADVCIQYGTTSGTYPNQTAWQTFPAGKPAEIVVNGLQANTQYFYRMCYRVPNSTTVTTRPEYKFRTQRAVGSTFSFIVQADPHMDEQSDSALYRLAMNNYVSDNPDFLIDLGDIFMSDKLANAARQITRDTINYRCKLMRNYYETACHSMPLFMAMGNHEGESGWQLNGTANNVAVWGTLERKKYYINPEPNNFYTGDTVNHNFVGKRENYFAWKWGDALFIVLDPYWYTSPKPDSLNGWRWTLGKGQYDWLKKTLETAPAKFKFVFAHQIVGGTPEGRGGTEVANLYEWGGNSLNGTRGFETNRTGWYKPIKDLLKEHPVNIFFHGHDHFFGKQEKDCLIYQESPQPSHPNFSTANYIAQYGYREGLLLPNSGYIRVTVSPNDVKVEYVRSYLPRNETATRKNKDVSATYTFGVRNCYDSLSTGIPVLWNSNYSDELIYPNPFEHQTTIAFSVQKAERISISIFNEKGQWVCDLLRGQWVNAGDFQTTWDGRHTDGSTLPNGVYVYRIRGEQGGETTGKMILMR
ncbi:MAG: metallophosphoesterase [Saprospiraceae bacterium]|nr:metallophosphoesterase [Saprospiraceae bacterium]